MAEWQQRDEAWLRAWSRRLPGVLLVVLLTAPLQSGCDAELACEGEQGCGALEGSGVAGAGGSSSGLGGAGSLGSAGGVSISKGGVSNGSGGANTAMGGAPTEGGSVMGGSSSGGAPGTAGNSVGGKSSLGGAGAGGASGSGGSSGSGGKSSTGGMSGAGGGGTGSAGMSSGGTGAVDPYASARQTCVDRVNQLRASKGLGPIPRLPSAEDCADGQAKKDSESGKAHGAFGDCVNEVQGWTGAAQNECPGYGSVASTLSTCIDQMWAEGPGGGHYDNMVSDSDFIACGFYTTPGGKVWMIQDFWSK